MGPEHLELLKSSARTKAIPLPRTLTTALRYFLRYVSLSDGMLRIYLTAGMGAPASPIRNSRCYLTWEKSIFPTSSKIKKGLRLTIRKNPFLGSDWGIKCGNYDQHLLAISEARSAGADEAIVLDGKGLVLSCAMGNLLVWLPSRRGVRLCTPPVGLGARSGVLLDWVIRNHRVMERSLRTSDISRAVAMAVTNSRLGVMPVTIVDGRILPDPSLSLALANDYLKSHGLFRCA